MIRSFLLLLFASVAVAQPARRMSPPPAADIETAAELVRDLYKADLAKKKTSEQLEAARKLMKAGDETNDNPAAKYSLYRESADLAGRAGDLGAALEAAALLLQHFDLKPVETQLTILEIADHGKAVPARAVVEAALEVADDAIRVDDHASATKLLKLAAGAAARASLTTPAATVAAKQRELEAIEQLYEPLAPDRKKLAADANHPEANFKIGRFTALRKGDWDAALPMLAKGSDEQWKAAAEQELSAPLAAEKMLALADRWFDLAASLEGVEAGAVHVHAYQWYSQAAADLTGLSKTRAEKRMQELEKSPDFKSAPGAGWRVLFRSADPAIWNTDTNRGRYQFALPLSKAPAGLRYLRLAETTKGTSVIIEMSKDKLHIGFEKDGYAWSGINNLNYNGHHLGIGDMAWKNTPKGAIDVCMFTAAYRGWGFGHRAFMDDVQGYAWNGEPIARTVFEIAVKIGPLTSDESKRLLKRKK
jgi:hypothetical protein